MKSGFSPSYLVEEALSDASVRKFRLEKTEAPVSLFKFTHKIRFIMNATVSSFSPY